MSAIGNRPKLNRSRQFIEGWRHAEKSLVTWLHDRARSMSDRHARAILDVAADDFGQWAKGRYAIAERRGPPDPQKPLAVFRAAVRREALLEAATIVEAYAQDQEPDDAVPAEVRYREIAMTIRAAVLRDGNT